MAFRLRVSAPIGNKNGSYILQEYISYTGSSIAKVAYDPYNNKWSDPFYYVNKNDLAKVIGFNGNVTSFRIRSGQSGLKNIYLDAYDASGNITSICFGSDGGNSIQMTQNGTTIWTMTP